MLVVLLLLILSLAELNNGGQGLWGQFSHRIMVHVSGDEGKPDRDMTH
jgi:hypothetical protein